MNTAALHLPIIGISINPPPWIYWAMGERLLCLACQDEREIVSPPVMLYVHFIFSLGKQHRVLPLPRPSNSDMLQ